MNVDMWVCPHHGKNCNGIIYIALSMITGVLRAKIGFVHSMPALGRREQQLRKEGFHIIWNTKTLTDKGGMKHPVTYGHEQYFHATAPRPIAGLEYYELDGQLILHMQHMLFRGMSLAAVQKQLEQRNGIRDQFASAVTFNGRILTDWQRRTGHPGPVPGRRHEELG